MGTAWFGAIVLPILTLIGEWLYGGAASIDTDEDRSVIAAFAGNVSPIQGHLEALTG